ncbi:collagen alpha-1(XII) chain-like isoform X2 [Rana temporaria]|uniref:collagen alpha-1(XII) chain-like isoform X2 n=1 Tax=Rana temporaria TaxID=8407 RepID=UPI001AAD627B|nr:collagen alpha-1(XII) chain-like isoform X2 [Rana temporaria]
MFVYLGLYLHILLSTALGHTIPEADHTSFIPDLEGDLLFLLDSSGSVTYDEFSNVKEFIGDLLRPFKYGPQDVQASVMQISTDPTLEFPLNQYTSSQDVQKAIRNIQQRMGDTNTGKALDYVKKQLYTEKFGSRVDVPKVMVWVTDGLSTDDISQPMQLLKDMGVTVFIVCTTGRGNFEELSAAASQPDEKHLKFVDKDDLGIITKELRDSIIELIQAKRLHALDITTTSFRLIWPRLLSRDTGHYVLEYSPLAYPRQKMQETLPGNQTSLVLNKLIPNTTYQVTLYPESNVDYASPQSIQVSTLHEFTEERKLEADDVTTTGFRLTWSRLSGDTGSYVLEYSVVSDPKTRLQKTLFGDETRVVLSNLLPNTTYQVTLKPGSTDKSVQLETIYVTTLPDLIRSRNLQVLNVTMSSFNVTWSKLLGDTGRYFLDYAPASDPRRKLRKTLYGDQTNVVVSNLIPKTTYQITFSPESSLSYIQSQTLQVTTLPDLNKARNLKVLNVTSTGFLLTWLALPGDTLNYTVNYVPISKPGVISQMFLHRETSAVIRDLSPNTAYEVTFIPLSNVQFSQSQTLQVFTLPDPVQERNLQVKDITSTSFLLTWARMPLDSGSYTVQYALASDPRQMLRKTLTGDDRVVIDGLTPDNTYRVTLIPESNAPNIQDVTIQVSTLPDLILARNLQIKDKKSTSFQLTWSRLSGDTGNYVIEYAPVTDLGKKVQKTLYGYLTSVVFSNLAPSTTYEVTFIPESRESTTQSQTIQVTTLPDPVQERNLQVKDITSTSFLITWSRMPFDSGSYTVQYALASDPRKMRRKTLTGDDRVLIDGLTPDNTYRVTLIPESNAPNIQDVTIQVSTLPDLILARNLHIKDKTSTSFQLTWSRLSGDTGNYVIEYAPVTDLGKKVQKTLYGYLTSVVFSNLAPSTTYEVTFIPESRESTTQSQTIQVTTLPGLIQKRNLHAWDISTSSFRLTWSRLTTDRGRYVLEYALVSDPQKKLRKMLTADETTVLISNLNPDTKYQATLHSEANVQYVPPQSIQIATLPEQLGPAQILISDPTAHSFRVSWGPHLDSVIGYEVQYGPLPSNSVQKVHVDGRFNTTIIEGLKSNTTYLVTVSAIFKSGGEKALSAIACTEINGTKVKYLHIEDLRSNSLKAVWGSADGNVQGYQIRCRRQAGSSSTISVAPETHSVQLTGLSEGTPTKICVRPVYKNGAGRNLCKKVKMHPGTAANSYSSLQTPLNGKKAVAQ